MPRLEHLTVLALRNVAGLAVGPAHRAALTGTRWRAAGHAAWRAWRSGLRTARHWWAQLRLMGAQPDAAQSM